MHECQISIQPIFKVLLCFNSALFYLEVANRLNKSKTPGPLCMHAPIEQFNDSSPIVVDKIMF